MVARRSRGELVFAVFNAALLAFFAVSVLYPFWALLVDSLSSPRAVMRLGLKVWPLEFSLSAYRTVIRQRVLGVAYANTVSRAVAGTALTVFVSMCAAYPLSKPHLVFRKPIMVYIVFTMFFSGGLIPSYLLIKALGMLDTRWVLIVPGIVSAFNLIVMRNFIYSIPESLEESALIDGANEIVILFRIIVPISKPILATVALWSAVGHWNAWFDAMIYVRDTNKIVLQLLLRRILLENQLTAVFEAASAARDLTGNEYLTEETVRAATLFVSVGPIIVLYPFLQRYFIRGIMLGAVKG